MSRDVAELIERLRRYAKDQGGWHNIDDTCEDAADRLAALQQRVEELEAQMTDRANPVALSAYKDDDA